MTTLGYLRVSSDKQDLAKQEHLLLKYAQEHDLTIAEFISMRTKQGLDGARSKGKWLGRPKGSRDRERVLGPYREAIRDLLEKQVSLRRITKLINPQLSKPTSYTAYQ